MKKRSSRSAKKSKPKAKKIALIILAGGAGFALLVFLILQGLIRLGFFGEVPNTRDLKSLENNNSSEIYAERGQLLGKYFIYDRTAISLADLSPFVVPALISTEDVRFYEHGGTDYRSMGRVLVKNILMGQRSAGGGSTLTRQLAKNLYPRERRGILWLVGEKFREGIIARRLEKVYTKDEILNLYLNTVPFGENVFGISAGAQRFFSKHPHDLLAQEAATLIGMLKATSTYNPRTNPEASLERRNVVLSQMEKYGHLSQDRADSIKALPLTIEYSPFSHIHGPAPYFREMIRLELQDWIEKYNKQQGTDYNLYTDGLKIYTTLDFNLQRLAERSFSRQMKSLQQATDAHYRNASSSRVRALLNQEMKRSSRYAALQKTGLNEPDIIEAFSEPVNTLVFDWDGGKTVSISPMDSIFASQKVVHGGLVSIDPFTGNIKAWIGGNNIRFFQYDQVASVRQAGSAFKPFVYAAALENGTDPCEMVSNEAPIFEEYENWSPQNHDGIYDGFYSMEGALTYSVNTVSAKYIVDAGFSGVIDLARAAGIQGRLPAVPSLALGTAEVSLLDLTKAYSIFANKGIPVEPRYILRIEDAAGKTLFKAPSPPAKDPVLSQETSLIMTQMMKSVVNVGTAASLRTRIGFDYELAGKTGTTQNNSDSWFVGYTPKLVTGVWVGLENPSFNQVYPLPFGSSRSAVPIWGDYHGSMLQNSRTRPFMEGQFEPLPEDLAELLNCPMYLDSLPQPNILEMIFGKPEDFPRERPDRKRDTRRKGLLERILEDLFPEKK
ncbi:MAG: transglycosylase domain-containing protein [Bacteroides sp.]|nr:transglycosylase domain-containing protein [Bacteroides sp.]